MKSQKITWRAILIGMLFSAIFAAVTVYFENRKSVCLTATQIPVMPYILLVVMVLLLNPFCRLIRIVRRFTTVEILIIFLMGMVSSGISTFGLSSQLVPIVGGLFNPEWNTRQTEWNRYVVPYLNSDYFVAAPGIQNAAEEYSRLADRRDTLKHVYDIAVRCRDTRDNLRTIEAASGAAAAAATASGSELANARNAVRETSREWQALQLARHLPDQDTVLISYPATIHQTALALEAALQTLETREKEAFRKVERFRRGLPSGLRAYPGIFPMTNDDFVTYSGRLRRLVHGRQALQAVQEAEKCLGETKAHAAPEAEAASTRRAAALLQQAATNLKPISDDRDLESRKQLLRQREASTDTGIIERQETMRQLEVQSREANRSQARNLRSAMAIRKDEITALTERKARLTRAQERVEQELTATRKVAELAIDLDRIQTGLRENRIAAAPANAEIRRILDDSRRLDFSLRRYLTGDVPWKQWFVPLWRWSILIALTYVVLITLNVLIFRQWAHHEKLTYPLMVLPKALVTTTGEDDWMPAIFRQWLFWLGFALAFSILIWNKYGNRFGISPIELTNSWYSYVFQTKFTALGLESSQIFFTMIGISFLIPKNVSFSLWFFYVLYMGQLQVMVWSGLGQDSRSFPWDWWYLANFRSSIGQGALIVFASVVVWKCRKYIFCGFRPRLLENLAPDEQQELKLSSYLFVAASAGLILMLWLSLGANPFYTVFSFLFILIVTIGLVRAVAEGGILGFQAFASPFHIIRAFFGLNQPWSATPLFAPIMVFYSILFLDIKTFIAPAIANSLKLRDEFKMGRAAFHLAIALAIAVAAITAVVTAIMLSYQNGGDSMEGWFYVAFPRSTMDTIRSMVKDAPATSPACAWWITGGAAGMGLLLWLRQFIFWLPHPIGMIMLVNPLMGAYWFSIFIGWLFNLLITRYGNKNTYQKGTYFFIGLIAGELFMIMTFGGTLNR